jgi:hypothetical protein
MRGLKGSEKVVNSKLTPRNQVHLQKPIVNKLPKNFQTLYEKPTAGLYPEPDETNPYPPNAICKNTIQIILLIHW